MRIVKDSNFRHVLGGIVFKTIGLILSPNYPTALPTYVAVVHTGRSGRLFRVPVTTAIVLLRAENYAVEAYTFQYSLFSKEVRNPLRLVFHLGFLSFLGTLCLNPPLVSAMRESNSRP